MIEVIGWVQYGEIELTDEESYGGLGGYFENGMRWNDYINHVDIFLKVL